MLFNFQLIPLNHIPLWSHKDQLFLRWFGLTYGWYWMDVGQDQLFQYSTDILQQWGYPHSDEDALPYVDYQVARLWHDLLDMLPAILEPIPAEVLDHVRPGRQALTWIRQVEDYLRHQRALTADEGIDWQFRATSWIHQRWLDVAYLTSGPRIWFWTHDQTVTIHWDNREVQWHSMAVWTADVGTVMLSVPAFLEEVQSFGFRLMHAMQERIADVEQGGRPDVTVDVPALMRDHRYQLALMERTIAEVQQRNVTGWHDVLEMIDRIKAQDRQ